MLLLTLVAKRHLLATSGMVADEDTLADCAAPDTSSFSIALTAASSGPMSLAFTLDGDLAVRAASAAVVTRSALASPNSARAASPTHVT